MLSRLLTAREKIIVKWDYWVADRYGRKDRKKQVPTKTIWSIRRMLHKQYFNAFLMVLLTKLYIWHLSFMEFQRYMLRVTYSIESSEKYCKQYVCGWESFKIQ